MFKSINPANHTHLASFTSLSDEALQSRLEQAEKAFRGPWKTTTVDHRCRLIRQLAQALRTQQHHFAQTISLEMGKPIAQAEAEVAKCALLCDYYAKHSPAFLQDRLLFDDQSQGMVVYQPIGAVLGIMPWNFPFWQALRFAVPALAAGNVILLKHAPNVPQCAQLLETLMVDVLGDPGLFQNLFIEVEQVEQVLAHPIVEGVALTGSERAGSSVAALAGRAIKKCVLELGGADAFIVLSDADLPAAVEAALLSRMNNSGQTCISAKRLIVEKTVAAAFTEQLIGAMKQLKVGDPMDRQTRISCLARPDLLDNLERQVNQSIDMGAEVLLAGGRMEGQLGNYFRPMLLGKVKPGMPAYEEELFGPVAVVFEVADEAAAVQLANDSRYGLGAAVWSADRERALRVARQVEAGALAINNIVRSDPRLPFGGVKRSGFGRELSKEGIKEFVNIKTIVVN
ncbi:MAG: NAD-dependent succinate-semialdehyde dehydrogenase [Bacteroidota bacterium]